MKINFQEEQKFTQWWLWVILILTGIFPIFGMYKQFVLGESFGNKPMSDLGLLLFSLIIITINGLFFFMKLKTTMDKNGIQIHFFPFTKKRVEWNEIKHMKVLNYGFVGGWGVRLWTKYGTVYNVKGNIGLAIELKNGKKFLIGTQKEIELRSFLGKIPAAASAKAKKE